MESLLADGYLMFLHRLKQGTLHLGWSTVDLICQDEVGKHRSSLHMEGFILLRIDLRTDYVGRQQIGCKLYAAIVCTNQL